MILPGSLVIGLYITLYLLYVPYTPGTYVHTNIHTYPYKTIRQYTPGIDPLV